MDIPAGANQLQAVRDELTRLQAELDETSNIKREAEAVNDPDLVAECAAAETRLKGLVEQLTAKAAALQKTSGAEALRARLQQLKTSEARARTLLGTTETPSAAPPLTTQLTGISEGSVSSAPAPIAAPQRFASGGSGPVSPSPSQRSPASAAREKSTSPGVKPDASAALPQAQPQPSWQTSFGEAPAFRPSPRAPLPIAPSSLNGHDSRSLDNNPRSSHVSLDSFGDSAFSGLEAASTSEGSAAAQKPAAAAPPSLGPAASADGFESAAFSRPASAKASAPLPAADFGFGESAFAPPGAPAAAATAQPPTKPGSREFVDMADAGRSISFRDSYPTGTEAVGAQSTARQEAAPGGSSWHAFPTASPQAPAAAQADRLPHGFQWGAEQRGSGSRPGSRGGGFDESAFTSESLPSRATASSPTASVRSGNPFADFSEPPPAAGPLSPTSAGASEAAQPPIPTRSVFADPFTSPAAPQAPLQADPFGSFASSFDSQPAPSQPSSSQPKGHPFGSPHHSHFPAGASGVPHLTMPGGQQYVVTPSMVIPEADWEAAFSLGKPAQEEKKEPPSTQPVIVETEEEGLEAGGTKEVWAPMTEHDRSRCHQAFQSKYGGEEVGLGAARELYARADIREPLERVFAVADLDGNGKLSYAEFLLFMYLLKVLRKGVTLPRVLSNERVSFLLGVDLASLGWSGKRSTDRLPQAPVKVETSSLQTLLALGASEEDAKRALFLSGEDVDAARQWLAERNKLGSSEGSKAAASSTERPGSGGRGGPHVLLKLEKAVLNYKKPVDRPLFQITLRDAWGEAVGQPVDTPPCTYDKSSGVFTAGHSVVLDTPVGDMPEGAVVYFELKHWKSKEKKWSTLAWTFVAKEAFLKMVDGVPRVRNEAQGMHLYEKPLDPRSHFRQGSMRKLKPISESPDFFLRVSEHE